MVLSKTICVNLPRLVKATEARDLAAFRRLTFMYSPRSCPSELIGVLWSMSCFNDTVSLEGLSPHLLSKHVKLSQTEKVFASHYYSNCGILDSIRRLIDEDVAVDMKFIS